MPSTNSDDASFNLSRHSWTIERAVKRWQQGYMPRGHRLNALLPDAYSTQILRKLVSLPPFARPLNSLVTPAVDELCNTNNRIQFR